MMPRFAIIAQVTDRLNITAKCRCGRLAHYTPDPPPICLYGHIGVMFNGAYVANGVQANPALYRLSHLTSFWLNHPRRTKPKL